MLTSIVLCLVAAPKSSAIEIGLMSGDNSWQEPSQWDVFQKSGAKVFRLMVQPEGGFPGTYWMERYDNAFKLAAERGIRMLPYLYNFTTSGQQFLTEAQWKEGGASSWDSWVRAVVKRYGYGGAFWSANPGIPYKPVSEWEVWNEPNLVGNNPGGKTVQPEEYGKFLKHTAEVIQAAQNEQSGGGTNVLFAGLISKGDMSVAEFLAQAKAGTTQLGSWFAGLSLHPYSGRSRLPGLQENVTFARNALNTSFSSAKSLWVTEVGWNVENEPGETENWVDSAEQANLLTKSFDWMKLWAGSWNIQSIIWFMYRDVPKGGLKWANYTGLRDDDGTFRPSWDSFQAQTDAEPWRPPPPSSKQWATWVNYTDDYADVTGDGKADLIGRYNSDIQVAPSNGAKFTTASTWAGWSTAYSASYADVNGDGKADLIGRYGTDIQVALSTGSKFGAGVSWTGWSTAYSASYADVNGDGKADLIGRNGGDIQVALSTGSSFNPSSSWINWSTGYSASYGDVDGDKKADLIGRNGANIQVGFSTGSKFNSGTNWFTNWDSKYTAEHADVDGDGKVDVIGRYGSVIAVFASGGPPPPPNTTKWATWFNYTDDYADVTGDGKADLIGRYNSDIQVAPSSGSKFNTASTWATWVNYSDDYADVNGDGKADLIGRYNSDIQVAPSNGAKFTTASTWATWVNYSDDYADVNGDGKADLIGRFGGDIQVALSDGSKFAAGTTWINWNTAYSASYGDVDGDKKADLIGRNGANIQVGFSTGSKFNSGTNWFNEWTAEYSADYADVSGDGKVDGIGRLGSSIYVFTS